MIRIAIGVLLSSGYRSETDFLFGRPDSPSEGLLALLQRINSGQANQSLPRELQLTASRLILSRKFPTDVARNEVCADVLARNDDYLLFLDADMVHPVDLLERLLVAQKPVITARYHIKKAPFAAIAYVKHRTQEGPHRYASIHFGQGVFEIERGGAGALLIRRDVLRAIADRQTERMREFMASLLYRNMPEWARRYFPPEPAPQWFNYQWAVDDKEGQRIDRRVSEDFWFYQQAREAGFSCWCDWDCVVPHIGPMAIDDSWNRPFLHTQVSEYENPETRDLVLNNTIVRGYPGGMVLGETFAIPEYQITPGER